MTDRPYAYETEVRLLRWGDTSASGKTITLELPPIEGPHPFNGFPTGPKGGQRFRMRFEPILDDETAVTETQEETEGKKAITIAVMLAKDPEFFTWLQANMRDLVVKVLHNAPSLNDEDIAKQVLRDLCGITSLSELRRRPEARKTLYVIENDYRIARGQRPRDFGG